ncbi:MAG: ferrous iron transport protein A [Parasporobacterium sp.]|nr:ferrous iron transport protein A [Parasporobacterium sp.]
MPLYVAPIGEKLTIAKVKGKEETVRFLGNLGFVSGADIEVVSESGGNMIVNVKGSRIAIGKDMAKRIYI